MKLVFPRQFKGHKYQQLIWESEKRFIVSLAGRRGGKNYVNARKFIKSIYRDFKLGKGNPDWSYDHDIPRLLYWCIAPDYNISKIQKQDILSVVGNTVLLMKDRPTRNEVWLSGGIKIEYKSTERPERLVAARVNGLWITEAARIKRPAWVDNVRPTLSDSKGWGLFDTTPLGHNFFVDDFWNFTQYGEHHDDEWEGFTWTTIENTAVPGLVQEVETARRTMPAKYFARNYEASLTAFQGQIYDEFDESVHVKDIEFKKENYINVIAGIDWGFTHKGVIVVCGIRKNGYVDVLDEVAESRVPVMTASENERSWVQIARDLAHRYDIDVFFAGQDEPEHIVSMKRSDIRIGQAENSVMPGIQTVATLLHPDNGVPRLTIDRKCKNLIREMYSYRWKENKDGEEDEAPEKINDDSQDALRYALFTAVTKKWLYL